MNLNALTKPNLRKAASRTVFAVRRFSPEILTTVGIAGTVTAAVFAAKATLRLEPIVDEINGDLKEAHARAEQFPASEYSSTDHKRDVLKVYIHGAGKLTKLYGPSLALGTVSIACIVGGHGVLYKRNVAAIAAYAGLEEQFKRYRARVAEEFGDDKDRDFRFGVREDIVVDDDGTEQAVVKIDASALKDDFIWVYDESNRNFKSSPDYNMSWVRTQEKMADDRLKREGFLFLNDALESLGFERTKTGALTGWVMDAEGDNFVDFGIIDAQSLGARVFGNADADAIYLNFNVDGIIIDQLPYQ